MKNRKKIDTIQIITLSHDWKKLHRKEFIKELASITSEWSVFLCLEPPVSLLFHTLIKYPNKFWAWLIGKRGCRKIGPNIFLYTPFMLTHYYLLPKIKLLSILEKWLLKIQIKKILDNITAYNLKRILWLIMPQQAQLAGFASEQFLIYDCYDEYSYDSFKNTLNKDIHSMEICLAKKADLVLVTSNGLFTKHIKNNSNTHLITNAARIELFSRALSDDLEKPKDIRGLTFPIIGYIGYIRNWLDFKLLSEIVQAKPEWNFVFIGDVAADCRKIFKGIASKPNVLALGFKEVEELPSYLKYFDAAIIPFLINKVTECVVPLKFFEYLAAGRRIVSTPLPDLIRFKDYIEIANTSSEFISSISKILQSPDNQLSKRLEIAKKNNWYSRAIHVKRLLKKL